MRTLRNILFAVSATVAVAGPANAAKIIQSLQIVHEIGQPVLPSLLPVASFDASKGTLSEVLLSLHIKTKFDGTATTTVLNPAGAGGAIVGTASISSPSDDIFFGPPVIEQCSVGFSGPTEAGKTESSDCEISAEAAQLNAFFLGGYDLQLGLSINPFYVLNEFYTYTGKSEITASLIYNYEAAVPEPAAWAMMIGGLGLVGGAMRRRRAMSVREVAHALG